MSAPAQAEGAPLPNIGTLQLEGTPIEVRCGSCVTSIAGPNDAA
jgi:hypothetical protein